MICIPRWCLNLGLVTGLLVQQASAQVLVDPTTSTWTFSVAEEQISETWAEPAFDDSQWQRGFGPLGFGESEIRTQVPAGSGRRVFTTTHFRTTFNVDEPKNVTRLLLTARIDDGFAAYLNGAELLRWNLPEGKVSSDSFATKRLEGVEEQLHRQFTLPSESLVAGENVLAVEIHQAGRYSSDLYLDLSLAALVDGSTDPPLVPAEAREVTGLYSHTHYVGPTIQIPDGFVDGGRGMQIDEFGYVVSGREIVTVDRRIDDRLQAHLEFSHSKELNDLSEVDKATRIARYVDRVFTPLEGRSGCESRSLKYLVGPYRAQRVPLGNVPRLCGAGVCRHRALLFKVMADEAGLNSSLVRGSFLVAEKTFVGHAWNELFLDDGKKVHPGTLWVG